ncbi:unnamed protein product [Ixodes hexagonus]
MGNPLKSFIGALVRRKKVTTEGAEVSQLNRCLSTFDLTLLGACLLIYYTICVKIGATCAACCIAPQTITRAGAETVPLLRSLCRYALPGRLLAGRKYYAIHGTLYLSATFLILWEKLCRYGITTGREAGFCLTLSSHPLEPNYVTEVIIKVFCTMWMKTMPRLLSFVIFMLLKCMLAIGVKESTRFNTVFTLVNLLVVVYVVIVGSFKADIANWRLKPQDIPRNDTGVGGFFPYGVGGMLNGAASCFYAFVGFDCIATMGEEVRNPRRAIPIGIVVSLTIVFLAYFGVSVIETLLWPYYDQNVSAPLPYVFDRVGWPVAKWVVSIGALAGLSTSLLGGMFPLPRVLYAMGSDGLIFRFLAIVHPRLKTPLLATLLSGAFAGTMAMIFNVEELANMMSIGTLLAYSLVAVSVLMLRYEPFVHCTIASPDASMSVSVSKRSEMYEVPSQSHGERASLDDGGLDLKPRSPFTTMFNTDDLQSPTLETSYLVKALTLTLGGLFCTMNGILVFAEGPFFNGDLPVVIPFAGLTILAVLCIIVITRQPSASTESLSFAVPFVPYIPMFNMFVNLYLMMRLPGSTWIRFAVWMVLGFLIYFGYGIFNSSQRKPSPPLLRDAVSADSVLSSDNQSDGEAQPLMSC